MTYNMSRQMTYFDPSPWHFAIACLLPPCQSLNPLKPARIGSAALNHHATNGRRELVCYSHHHRLFLDQYVYPPTVT
jgi:hypothetical protein